MRTLVLGTPPPNQPLLVTPLGRPAEAVAVYERRLAGIEREVGGTNGRLEVTNIRLGHLEELAEQLVDLVGNGFCDLREDNRMIRAELHQLTAEVRELRIDHARVDRLEARVDRPEQRL
jgi:hypothetical protein